MDVKSACSVVNVFVSYAHADGKLPFQLLDLLQAHLKISKGREYRIWQDTMIPVGAKWREEIDAALAACDAGLLLVSPHFLGSEFVTQVELTHLLDPGNGKVVLPVMLRPVDFELHNLKGLDALQIFRHVRAPGQKPFAFDDEYSSQGKKSFARDLFKAIEGRMIAGGA